MRNNRFKNNYYLSYTVLFFIYMCGILSWFIIRHKSLVWIPDGLPQHYNAFVYYGTYLRSIIRDSLKNRQLVIPQYDFSIGYGADVLTTLHFYVIGDPLNLLSALVKPPHAEYLYGFLAVLRVYLAGLTFSLWCRRRNADTRAVLLGASCYITSGYVIYFMSRHPFFMNGMIYLPLVLLGIDLIYSGKSCALYICSVAAAGLSNFYFLYMIGILAVLYAVFTYFTTGQAVKTRNILIMLLRFCLYSLLGISIAAVCILPTAAFLLRTTRYSTQNYIPILYGIKYYARFLSGFVTNDSPGYQNIMCFSPFAFLCVAALFIQKKKRAEKLAAVLGTLLLLIPYIGHLMNGFSYVSNRWSFGYTMLISWIVSEEFSSLSAFDKKQKQKLGMLVLMELFLLVVLTAAKGSVGFHSDQAYTLGIGLILTLSFCCLLLPEGSAKTRKLFLSFLLLTAVSTVLNSYDIRYREDPNDKYTAIGKAWETLSDPPSVFLKQLPGEGSFWRYNAADTGEARNASLQTGLHSETAYFSMVNPFVSEFQRSLYLNEPLEQIFNGSSGRTELALLSGVKYQLASSDTTAFPGFVRAPKELQPDASCILYESSRALPAVFSYSSVTRRSDFEKLPIEEKQTLLLQQAVVEDNEDSILSVPAISGSQNGYVNPPVAVSAGDNCECGDKTIAVRKINGKVYLDFELPCDGEYALILENFDYQIRPGSQFFSTSKLDNYLTVRVVSAEEKHTIKLQNPHCSVGYCDRHDFLCQLGTCSAGKQQLELYFKTPGTYIFSDLRISCRKQDSWEEYFHTLEDGVSGTISETRDGMHAELSLDEDRFLCFAIPADSFWKAFVDGSEAELLRTDIMYLGLPLQAGAHSIEFIYDNPWHTAGSIVTLSGTCLSFLLVFLQKRHKS